MSQEAMSIEEEDNRGAGHARACSWREEERVDLLMNRLPACKRSRLLEHIPSCPGCRESMEIWGSLLSQDRDLLNIDSMDSSEQMSRNSAASANELGPSERLRRRLHNAVRLRLWLRALKSRPVLAFAASVLILLFAALKLVPDLADVASSGQEQPSAGVREEWEKGMTLVRLPDTVKYRMLADQTLADPLKSEGYIWVNSRSGEMLLLVDGLEPLEEQEYQAWMSIPNRNLNAGLLHWMNGKAQLYVDRSEIRLARSVFISVEPKGGSFQPTGPSALFIKLHEEME